MYSVEHLKPSDTTKNCTNVQFMHLSRRCETIWNAREIAPMALSAEQARHTENVFHIALSGNYEISDK